MSGNRGAVDAGLLYLATRYRSSVTWCKSKTRYVGIQWQRQTLGADGLTFARPEGWSVTPSFPMVSTWTNFTPGHRRLQSSTLAMREIPCAPPPCSHKHHDDGTQYNTAWGEMEGRCMGRLGYTYRCSGSVVDCSGRRRNAHRVSATEHTEACASSTRY